MSSASLPRIGALALCLVLVAALPLAGAPQSGASSRPAATSEPASAGFWTLLLRTVHSLWSKAGCRIDPYGICVSDPAATPTTTHTDAGCSLDPYGRCLSGS